MCSPPSYVQSLNVCLMADGFDSEETAENISEKTHQGEIWPTSFDHKYVRDRGVPDAS